ncbi:hypothetical protein B4U80_11760, partial [Leptotrombidium deliense]
MALVNDLDSRLPQFLPFDLEMQLRLLHRHELLYPVPLANNLLPEIMQNLPSEILLKIFSYLEDCPFTLFNCMHVCKRWSLIVSHFTIRIGTYNAFYDPGNMVCSGYHSGCFSDTPEARQLLQIIRRNHTRLIKYHVDRINRQRFHSFREKYPYTLCDVDIEMARQASLTTNNPDSCPERAGVWSYRPDMDRHGVYVMTGNVTFETIARMKALDAVPRFCIRNPNITPLPPLLGYIHHIYQENVPYQNYFEILKQMCYYANISKPRYILEYSKDDWDPPRKAEVFIPDLKEWAYVDTARAIKFRFAINDAARRILFRIFYFQTWTVKKMDFLMNELPEELPSYIPNDLAKALKLIHRHSSAIEYPVLDKSPLAVDLVKNLPEEILLKIFKNLRDCEFSLFNCLHVCQRWSLITSQLIYYYGTYNAHYYMNHLVSHSNYKECLNSSNSASKQLLKIIKQNGTMALKYHSDRLNRQRFLSFQEKYPAMSCDVDEETATQASLTKNVRYEYIEYGGVWSYRPDMDRNGVYVMTGNVTFLTVARMKVNDALPSFYRCNPEIIPLPPLVGYIKHVFEPGKPYKNYFKILKQMCLTAGISTPQYITEFKEVAFEPPKRATVFIPDLQDLAYVDSARAKSYYHAINDASRRIIFRIFYFKTWITKRERERNIEKEIDAK